MDVQGRRVAEPWVNKAHATYPTLVDQYNYLGEKFNFNYVPLIILFNKPGEQVYGPTSFSIDDAADRRFLLEWIQGGQILNQELEEKAGQSDTSFEQPGVALRFKYATFLMSHDEKQEALWHLRKAVEEAPGNWIIRKQIWAIEHPARFYNGDVDFDWQREQLQQERR